MVFRPTKNMRPLELLLERERATLLEWPHGWIVLTENGVWQPQGTTPNKFGLVYRGIEPTIKVWCNVYQDDDPAKLVMRKHRSREAADESATDNRIGVVRIDSVGGVITMHMEDL